MGTRLHRQPHRRYAALACARSHQVLGCSALAWLSHCMPVPWLPPSELAQAVVDAGAVPLLVLCIQEPEISLKRITASALNDIAKHSPELAQAVVDAGAVAYLAPLIQHDDGKLKRQVCSCLAQIAKHSVDLAEVVVEWLSHSPPLPGTGIVPLSPQGGNRRHWGTGRPALPGGTQRLRGLD